MLEQKIKVLIADNHSLMRHVIKDTLECEDDMIVVAEATDGEEAVNLAREVSPDVILMDVDMPKKNGITATKEIMSGKNKPRIIGFSASINRNIKRNLIDAGAVAFLSKSDIDTICATVRRELLAAPESKCSKSKNKSSSISKNIPAVNNLDTESSETNIHRI